MNMVGPYYVFGVKVVKATIEAEIPYVDINDDFQPTVEVLDNYSDSAKEANIAVFIGCGVAPGLTNMLAKLGSTELDHTRDIYVEWLGPSVAGIGPGVVNHIYNMISGECVQYINGEYKMVPSGGESKRLVSSDGRFDADVFYVGHAEPASLPRYIVGVRNVINKGGMVPGEAVNMYRSFMELGMNDRKPIEINGQKINLADVVVEVLKRKLKDDPNAQSDDGYFQITVRGTKDGKEKEVAYEMVAGMDVTAWTASVVAQMIIEGKITDVGVHAPEVMTSEQIKEVIALREKGLVVKRIK